MRRPSLLALAPAVVAATVAAPLALGAQAPAQPAANVTSAPVALPTGWQMRLDRPGAKTDGMRFVTMGKGLHATTGPAAIFWDPANTASGNYTVEASFTQTKAPAHPEAYGVILGGKNLDGDAQDYLYFIVRGDGKYMINHRAGAQVHKLTDWTANAAVKPADAAGKATNALRVRVGADSVRFDVNGTQVDAKPRGGMVGRDGIVGLRVNHMLDVHVDGPRVSAAGSTR